MEFFGEFLSIFRLIEKENCFFCLFFRFLLAKLRKQKATVWKPGKANWKDFVFLWWNPSYRFFFFFFFPHLENQTLSHSEINSYCVWAQFCLFLGRVRQGFTFWSQEWVRRPWGLLVSPERFNKIALVQGKKNLSLSCPFTYASKKRKYCLRAWSSYSLWILFLGTFKEKVCCEPASGLSSKLAK